MSSELVMHFDRHKPLIISEKEVQIHLFSITKACDLFSIAHLNDVLSIDERAKIDKFRFTIDQKRAVVSRGVLRLLLSRYMDCRPSELKIINSKYGKPSLIIPFSRSNLSFNVSHSQEYILYGFTKYYDIGVDIEYMDPKIPSDDLATQNFSEHEMQSFRSIPESLKVEAFFNCWTRKEAFVKAVGEGLSYLLKDFDVTLKPGEPAKLLDIRRPGSDVAEWSLRDIDINTIYKAAWVVRGTVSKMNYYKHC